MSLLTRQGVVFGLLTVVWGLANKFYGLSFANIRNRRSHPLLGVPTLPQPGPDGGIKADRRYRRVCFSEFTDDVHQ